MAPPNRVEHSDVMMLLPDRVGRLKHRVDNFEDVHLQEIYANQSKHGQMLHSLDDRFADHEARLIELQAQISRLSTANRPIVSHRGPGALTHQSLSDEPSAWRTRDQANFSAIADVAWRRRRRLVCSPGPR